MKKRILFVDDEPNILSSMKRMLRSYRKSFSMAFVESGQEALECMAKEPYHVIVSDMRMPGMDGAELLRTVRGSWPNTICIMLTGQADSDSLLRTVNVVHHFLMKPCERDDLQDVLERACALHTFLNNDLLQGIVKDIDVRLDLPEVYLELAEIIDTAEATGQQVVQCIAGDAWMGSMFLQLINRGDEDSGENNYTLEQAIDFVGLDRIKLLVLGLHLFRRLQEFCAVEFSFEEIIQHSLYIACCAKEIAEAENAGRSVVTDAFIGGLLHDIGHVILVGQKGKTYREILDIAEQEAVFVVQAEQKILSVTHAEIGAYLLMCLGFPMSIIEIVAYHHQLDQQLDTSFSGLTAVHVANSHIAGINNSSCRLGSVVAVEYLAQVGCSEKLALWENLLTN